MAYVTLYSFYVAPVGVGPGTLYTVVRDDTDLTFIDFYTTSAIGGPSQPPDGTIISVICEGTTKYTYKVKTALSYATYETEANSYYCGYTPPTCDIFIKSFKKTDETGVGANDGTANLFAVSSFSPITYFLYDHTGALITSNTVGLFTGLAPGDYSIKAVDTNPCTVEQFFTIVAYDPSLTRCKYRMQFKSILGGVTYRLDFLDQKHQYDPATHPIYLEGTDTPLKKTTANPNEDKTEPILATTLDINIWHTGIIDVENEFAKVDERTWFMQLYRNDVLDFQGWLLPDQINDNYADPNYPLSFTATDGLASLKGANFGDPTIFTIDSNGNKIYTQLYGLFGWSYLVRVCLDWLNYDYGNTTLVSSLQNAGAYDEQFWSKVSTWGDNYYDSSGNPTDVYTALSNLLKSVKLTIVQVSGSFVICNWNDLWYINKGLQLADYNLAFYTFNADMTGVINTGSNQPSLMPIGAGRMLKPIKPMQTVNYDLSFGIMKAVVPFNTLALLYENPSFEIGAVQGDLPVDYNHTVGTVDAFVNYDPPIDGSVYSGAYNGQWELKVKAIDATYGTSNFFENNSPFFTIDQTKKVLNISFAYRVPNNTNLLLGTLPQGYIFSFTAIFIDGSSGNAYFLKSPQSKDVSYQDYVTSGGSHQPHTIAGSIFWEALGNEYYTEGDAAGIKSNTTTNYDWQNFSITSPVFPETELGTLSVRFYAVKQQLTNTDAFGALAPGRVNGFYTDCPASDDGYYLIDDLNITLSDASNPTNLQIGETHTVTNVTNYSKAQTKELDLTLFTYPPNKRLAGQFMYGLTYDTAVTMNALKFKLQTTALKGRLPAAIIQSWARTYQQPQSIWEGEVKADNVPFYGVYTLDGYDGLLFYPFSVSADLRNSEVHMVIVAFDDSDAQVIYNYTAKYQRNSRENG